MAHKIDRIPPQEDSSRLLAQADGAKQETYNILVVDDDALLITIAKDILCAADHTVFTAADASKGLHVLKRERIDAVLLDINMPGESGFDMAPKIKEISPDSAVIIMTAFASTDFAIEAIQIGVDDFIRKPLESRELLHAIKKAVDKKDLIIQNRELTHKLERRLSNLELLKGVSEEISSTLNLRELLQKVMETTKAAIGAEACSVLLFDDTTNELVFEVALGEKSKDVKMFRIKPGDGIAGWVFKHREPLIISDVREDTRFLKTVDKKTGFESKSMIAVPLTAKNTTLGVIQVINSVGRDNFEIEDRDSLVTLSGQIAVAIDNARMTENLRSSKAALQHAHDELEKRVKERTAELSASNTKLQIEVTERKGAEKRTRHHLEQLAVLRSIDKAIVGSLDVGITLDMIIEHAMKQLKVDAADVLLYKPHLDTLEYAASGGFNTQALKYTRLKIGSSHAGRAALERRIVHIPDIRKESGGFQQSEELSNEGFVSYYGAPLIAKGAIKGVLELFTRSVVAHDQEWLGFLEALTGQAAIAIDNSTLFDNLQRANVELSLSYDATIEGWSRALDLRDKETEGHSRRVTELTLRVADILGVSDEKQVHMRRGALLHDIGKMGIPDRILLKPGKLDDEEWVIMKKHPQFAHELLFPVEYLRPALDIPYCHHEKWDGTGYPQGLKGEQIPLAARIFAAVDIYDAMRSDRPYHNPTPKEKVLDHIRSLAGSHLDPRVVEAFLALEDTST
jgi:response regulator RpfG family c-di-GMP phosphodiesterase